MEEDVDIISMSWAIDKETTPGPNDNQRLCDAIKTAAKKNILLFCANPDRGPTFKAMDTYPKAADPERVFCIGAATPDGIRWGQIDAQDTSCDYFLPGIELGIQVESTSRKNQHEPPQEWLKHSGSSLSCALAAGLAAMILHCSLVSGVAVFDSPKWKWLRSYEGMSKSFKTIQVEPAKSSWLPVRRFFQPAVDYINSGKNEDKARVVRDIVTKIFKEMPASIAEADAEPGPVKLSRRPTSIIANSPV